MAEKRLSATHKTGPEKAGITPRFFRRIGALCMVLSWCLLLPLSGHAGMTVPMNGEAPRKTILLPVVAGYFYPADRDTLAKDLRGYLDNARKKQVQGRVRGLVCPHAGYPYSAVVAAAGYRLLDKSIKKVIVIGASHHHPFLGVSIPAVDMVRTPLGDIPLAKEAALLRENVKGISYVPEAHVKEHSVEVHEPFLQMVLDDFEIIPIVCGTADASSLAEVLLHVIDENTLVVASSDLSHYKSYETARDMDRVCIDAVPALDFSRMDACECCGKVPVLALMRIAQALGWKGQLVDAQNSGDTAGNKDRVVGYMAVAFTETQGGTPMEQPTSQKDKKDLLMLARSAIRAKLVQGAAVVRPKDPSPALLQSRGCFVTLHDRHGDLRGCIGNIEPVRSLMEGVEENAKNAAFDDPRFSPLSPSELNSTQIEVSVLTVPKPLSFDSPEDLLAKLKPGVHGVILSKGMRRATFLPQVWEQIPNKENFLIQLCRKAGMTPNAWRDPDIKVEIYEAEHFNERR